MRLSPAQRARTARWAMWFSIPAWPVSQLTLFKAEPPGILGLSWLALIISLSDLAATTDVREHAGPADEADHSLS